MKITSLIPTRTSKQTESVDKDFHVPLDRRMTLAYEDMSDLAPILVRNMSSWVEFLDLSYNRIRDVRFLVRMNKLHTLILDHNLVMSSSIFPKLPQLRVLWINFNLISNIDLFIPALSHSCPNLEVLSLMGNVAAKSHINDATPEQRSEYRRFVISYFPNLRHLDDQPVTPIERLQSQVVKSQKGFLDDFMVSIRAIKESYYIASKKPNSIV